MMFWFSGLSLILQKTFCSTFQEFLMSIAPNKYDSVADCPSGIPAHQWVIFLTLLCPTQAFHTSRLCFCQACQLLVIFVCLIKQTFYFHPDLPASHLLRLEPWGIEMAAKRACFSLMLSASLSRGLPQLRGAAISRYHKSISVLWIPLAHTTWHLDTLHDSWAESPVWIHWMMDSYQQSALQPSIRRALSPARFLPFSWVCTLLLWSKWTDFMSECVDLVSKTPEWSCYTSVWNAG